jgi:hypothetical protein
MFKVFGPIVYLFLTSIVINVAYAASFDNIKDYDHQIEEELQKFTEIIIKFSFEKRIKTPLEISALFQIGIKLSVDIACNLQFTYIKMLENKLLTTNGKSYNKICLLHSLNNLIKDKKLNENFTEHYEVSDQIKDLNRPIYNRLDTASDDALFHVMNKIKSNEFSNEQCMAFFFLKLNTLANLRSYNEQLDKYLDMYFNFFSSHTEILDVTNFTDLRNWDQFYKENFEVIPNQSLKFFEPWNIALRYCMISEQIMIMIFAHKNGNFSILPRELIRYVINTMIFCPEILSPGYMISSATKSALSSSISAVLTWIWPK